MTDGALNIDLTVPYGAEAVLDLPVTDASAVRVGPNAHSGEPLGPGRHRIVVSEVRIADPRA